MKIAIRREATWVRVQSTPEAMFMAAGVLAIVGLILAATTTR